jgi:hypothetical protein
MPGPDDDGEDQLPLIGRTRPRQCGLSYQVAQSCIRHVGAKYAAMRSNDGCPLIAVEQLDGIRDHRRRKAQRAEIHRWAYRQLLFWLLRASAPGNRNRKLLRCQASRYTHHADAHAAVSLQLCGILLLQPSE